MKHIAHKCRMTETNASRIIAELEQNGHLIVDRSHRQFKSNVYTIPTADVLAAAPRIAPVVGRKPGIKPIDPTNQFVPDPQMDFIPTPKSILPKPSCNHHVTVTLQTDPQKGLLAPSGAEDVQPIEPEPITTPAGVLSEETTPEQTLTSKGNGSRQDTSPAYAAPTPDVGRQRDAIPYDRKAVFSALVEVCHVEPKAMRGPLNQTVKRLSLAEEPPAPAEVRALYGRDGPWYATDWRGDKRPAPTLAQVVSELVKMREAVRARVKVETSRAQGAGEW